MTELLEPFNGGHPFKATLAQGPEIVAKTKLLLASRVKSLDLVLEGGDLCGKAVAIPLQAVHLQD